MMWSDLKAVMAWFRGEQDTNTPETDAGVASLMRLVAANTMAGIRKAQEQAERLPYQSDGPECAAPASANAPDSTYGHSIDQEKEESAPHHPGPAAAQRDEQDPPQEA